jgi:hypothetical protein
MPDQLSRTVTGLVVSYATTVQHENIARFAALGGDYYEAHTDAEAWPDPVSAASLPTARFWWVTCRQPVPRRSGRLGCGKYHDPGFARL